MEKIVERIGTPLERIGTYNSLRDVPEGCMERIGTYNNLRDVREGCTERKGTYNFLTNSFISAMGLHRTYRGV